MMQICLACHLERHSFVPTRRVVIKVGDGRKLSCDEVYDLTKGKGYLGNGMQEFKRKIRDNKTMYTNAIGRFP
jgi:hypothetical protein